MKTIQWIMLFCAATGLAWGEPLTEDSIRRFLDHRDTLMVQGDADQISTLYVTNATVGIGQPSTPFVEVEFPIRDYLESFTEDDRPACISHQTVAKQIDIDAKGQKAKINTEVRTVTETGKHKRVMTTQTSETLTLGWVDGNPKIIHMTLIEGSSRLELDEFSAGIIEQVQTGPPPGKDQALEYLEEMGATYQVQTNNQGETMGDIRLRRHTPCGDEVLALATQFSDIDSLSITLTAGFGVTGKGLEMIKNQENIEMLWIGSGQITDADMGIIGGLTNLAGLMMTSTPITDNSIVHLKNLQKLRALSLMGTQISGAGIQQLKKQLPNLRFVMHESLIDYCKENRQSIGYAKRKWAEKQGIEEGALPTEADLRPHLNRSFSNLKCPDGGIISINSIGTPSSCSIHGQTEPRKRSPQLKGLSKHDFDVEGATVGRWTMDLDAAKQLAVEQQLPILVNFTGSDWCYWCKLMEKNVFSKPEWSTYATQNIVMVLIDFPKDKHLVPENFTKRNTTLKKQYGIGGYPTFVLLAPDGATELGRLKAGKTKTPESFINEVKALLNSEEEQ